MTMWPRTRSQDNSSTAMPVELKEPTIMGWWMYITCKALWFAAKCQATKPLKASPLEST